MLVNIFVGGTLLNEIQYLVIQYLASYNCNWLLLWMDRISGLFLKSGLPVGYKSQYPAKIMFARYSN